MTGRADQLHRPGEGVDAVGESGQARPAAVGAADAVVTHRQVEGVPAVPD